MSARLKRARALRILLVRSGFIERYTSASGLEKQHWGQKGQERFAGLAQGEDMAEYLWNNVSGAERALAALC